ncbi:DUF6304 family protein [Streptomyces sp. NPDC015242]|uniref:DUF6304 family protein n=1 Tax=Streptomyces sp. NPDC015242 TaxID=3364951 RepID=UPI0036F8ABC1
MNGLQRLPGRYTDRHGAQDVVFESDGRELIRTTIRGVRFEGESMDALGALSGEPPAEMFRFLDGDLCSCLLEWEVPLRVDVAGRDTRAGVLRCALRLGDPGPAPHRGLDEQSLTVALRLDGHTYGGPAGHDDFEAALYDIQHRLPPGARLRACVACAWSDYSPAGHGLMAGLACFRDAKDRYRRVDGKHGPHGIFALWPERTEQVQETHLCGEFEPRGAHGGYRGPFP